MVKLCPPALIYLIFSLIQIFLDLVNQQQSVALTKTFVAVVVTALLHMLCLNGLGVISWIIVFIPFMLMTVIVALLMYTFGLGDIPNADEQDSDTICMKHVSIDSETNNLIIYAPNYDEFTHPVYYSSPNIVVPKTNFKSNN